MLVGFANNSLVLGSIRYLITCNRDGLRPPKKTPCGGLPASRLMLAAGV